MSFLDRTLERLGLRRTRAGMPLTGRANYCPRCGEPLDHADASRATTERGRDMLNRTGRCPEHGWLKIGWRSVDSRR